MKTKSRVLKETICYSGKWLQCVEIAYKDEAGKHRVWEGIHREHHTDAVVAVPRFVPSGQYLLIKQFRPPLDAYILEFPAGLIDPGETPEEAAQRELKEETGYTGTVTQISPRLFTSPGILSEACLYASVEIDETLEANQNPQPSPEPQEFIETFLVAPERLASFFEEETQQGSVVDAKLYAYLAPHLFPSQ